MMKTRQENDVTNHTGVATSKLKLNCRTNLIVCDLSHKKRQDNDMTYHKGVISMEYDIEQPRLIELGGSIMKTRQDNECDPSYRSA